MIDDDFPSDSSAPVIKGTLWYPRPKALPLRPNSAGLSVKLQGEVGHGEFKAANLQGQDLLVLDSLTGVSETILETAERLRLQARQGHRKYKGPNFYSQFTRRAPATQVQAKDMKPETQELAENLVRMLPQKGQRKVVN